MDKRNEHCICCRLNENCIDVPGVPKIHIYGFGRLMRCQYSLNPGDISPWLKYSLIVNLNVDALFVCISALLQIY